MSKFKDLYERINDIDISINDNDLKKYKEIWEERYSTPGRYIERLEISMIRLAAGSPESKNNKGVYFKKYVKKHPEILSTRIFKNTVENYSWMQKVRFSNDSEKLFLKQSYEIHNGLFAETLNSVYLYKNGQIKKALATSGLMNCVLGIDIFETLPKESELKKLQENLDMIVFVHNHPDRYEKYKVSNPSMKEINKILMNSGLSKQDIKMTDGLYTHIMKEKVPIAIMAISENGLTYTYLAGTAKTIM